MDVSLEMYRRAGYPSQGQLPQRIPPAPYRHAAPCGPWPWQNLDDPIPPTETTSNVKHRVHLSNVEWDPDCEGCHWSNYPESLYANWKADQVGRSKMITTLPESGTTTIYQIDIDKKGQFWDKGRHHINEEEWDVFQRAVGEPVTCILFSFLYIDTFLIRLFFTSQKTFVFVPSFWITSRFL